MLWFAAMILPVFLLIGVFVGMIAPSFVADDVLHTRFGKTGLIVLSASYWIGIIYSIYLRYFVAAKTREAVG